MSTPLAVFTPYLGLGSETFIRRHVSDLLPGRTLTVTTDLPTTLARAWTADGVYTAVGHSPPSKASWRRHNLVNRMLGRPQGMFAWAPSQESQRSLLRHLQSREVTVVLTEYLDVWLPVVEAVRGAGIHLFAHAHGYDVSERLRDPWWRRQYKSYAGADGIVVVSAASKRKLVDAGLVPGTIHVIPCGVDVPDQVPGRPERRETRFVAVGRMCAKKGPVVTLTAFLKAGCPGRLTMLGDGPLFSDALAFVQAHRMQDRVSLPGAADHRVVLDTLRGGDVFVQHSQVDPGTGDEEGLPVGILEAMAAALPVVSTRHGGIPEAVVDGTTGFLVDEGDVDGMAEVMTRLAEDSSLRQRLGGAAWERAAANFSWPSERARLLDLLSLTHPA